MLDLVALSFLVVGQQQVEKLPTIQPLSWHQAEVFVLPRQPDEKAEQILQEYIRSLESLGVPADRQGVWIQSNWTSLADRRGKIPLAAASLTKIATTLASLETWGSSHQFETKIYSTGSVKNGVLEGDLIVEGSGDPLFVWEEAIAIGNAIEQLGIKKVDGNLIVVGDFYMNFSSNTKASARLLRAGLNYRLWNDEARGQHAKMPRGTLKPNLEVSREVLVRNDLPADRRLLMRHLSLPLAEILRQMNIYSNNYMAQMLTDSIGGGKVVAKIAANSVNVPEGEINLINGSGLGVDNRISPRAVCAMLMAIEQKLKPESITVADLFPVSGRDRVGTLKNRNLPPGSAVKTGSLSGVSSLAGVIPTEDRGLIWFAIINHGNKDLNIFRAKQDRFLQRLAQHWQLSQSNLTNSQTGFFGDPSRNVLSE